MTKFSKKRCRNTYPVLILLMMLFIIGICMLSKGNTIRALETNTKDQAAQNAAVMTIQNSSKDQTSTTVHILAFGLVIVVSGVTAGILIAVRKRNKRKNHLHF